jgi:hypothetical protein
MCSGRSATNSNSGKNGALISLVLSHSCGTVVYSPVKSLCRILKARPVCLVMLDTALEANEMDEKGCPHGDGKGFLVLYI